MGTERGPLVVLLFNLNSLYVCNAGVSDPKGRGN